MRYAKPRLRKFNIWTVHSLPKLRLTFELIFDWLKWKVHLMPNRYKCYRNSYNLSVYQIFIMICTGSFCYRVIQLKASFINVVWCHLLTANTICTRMFIFVISKLKIRMYWHFKYKHTQVVWSPNQCYRIIYIYIYIYISSGHNDWHPFIFCYILWNKKKNFDL